MQLKLKIVNWNWKLEIGIMKFALREGVVRHFGNWKLEIEIWKLKSFGLRPRSIRPAAVTPGCLVCKTILVALCLSRFLARLFPHAVKFMQTDSLGLRPPAFPTTASFPKRLCLSAWTRSAFPSVVLVLKIFWVFLLPRCARAHMQKVTRSAVTTVISAQKHLVHDHARGHQKFA